MPNHDYGFEPDAFLEMAYEDRYSGAYDDTQEIDFDVDDTDYEFDVDPDDLNNSLGYLESCLAEGMEYPDAHTKVVIDLELSESEAQALTNAYDRGDRYEPIEPAFLYD